MLLLCLRCCVVNHLLRLTVLHRRKADGGIHRAVLGVTAAPFGQFEEETPRLEWTGIKVEEFAAAGITVVENLQALQRLYLRLSTEARQQILIVIRRDR